MYKSLTNAQDIGRAVEIFSRGEVLSQPEGPPNFIFLVGSPAVGKTTQAAEIIARKGEDIGNYYTVSLDSLVENVEPYHKATWRTYNALSESEKRNIEEHMGKFSGRYTTVISSQRNNFGMTKNLYPSEKKHTEAYPITTMKHLRTIMDDAITEGVKQGYNILYDTTLAADAKEDKIMKILEIINAYAPRKYKIHVILIHAENERIRGQLAHRHQEMISSKGERAIRGISYKIIPLLVKKNALAFMKAKSFYKPDGVQKTILGPYTSDDFEFEVIGKPLSEENNAGNGSVKRVYKTKSAKGGRRRMNHRTRRQGKAL